jgi:hypothetical protein
MVFVNSAPFIAHADDDAAPVHGRDVCGQKNQNDGNRDTKSIHFFPALNNAAFMIWRDYRGSSVPNPSSQAFL